MWCAWKRIVEVAHTTVPVKTVAAAKREANFIYKPSAFYSAGITVLPC